MSAVAAADSWQRMPPLSIQANWRRWLPSLLLAVAVGCGIGCSFSASLDDHDSCAFAAAVERFSIAENRPHPPGYPFYVLAGKALVPLAGDAVAALRWLSVLAAAVAAALLPALFQSLGCRRGQALALAALTIATPAFWLTGSKVLTDMPAFAVLVALWVWHLRGGDGRRAAFGLGVAAGLAAGVRPHLLLPLLPFLLQRPAWPRLLGALLGCTVWYGGMMLWAGADDVLRATASQAMMRFHQPNVSLFVGDGPWRRAVLFVRHTVDDACGVPFWRVGVFVLTALVVGAAMRWRRLPAPVRSPRQLLLAGTAGYLLFVFMLLPAHPRYFLPAMPVLALLATGGSTWLAAAAAAVIGLGVTLPRALILHRQLPAPVQALARMDAVDPGRRVPLFSSHLYSHALGLAPERVTVADCWNDAAEPPIGRCFTDHAPWIERARLGQSGLTLVDGYLFERDEHVHDKEWRVRLALIERRP